MNKELLESNGYKVSKVIRDSLFNKPTAYKDICTLCPITVNDFEEFNEKYANFILINHSYLGIPETEDLITALVLMNAYQKQLLQEKEDITEGGKFASRLIVDPLKRMQMQKEEERKKEEKKKGIRLKEKFVAETLDEFSEMLSFLTGEKITPSQNSVGFDVWNEDGTSCKSITNEDFMVIREIVLTQNALVEPVKYHDAIVDEWMQKARNARRRKDINFNDLIIAVKNSTNLKYEEIAEMNMIQFYSDYRWVNHKNDYDASILFKTVSNKVPNITFATNITELLFANNEGELSMDASVMTSKLGD